MLGKKVKVELQPLPLEGAGKDPFTRTDRIITDISCGEQTNSGLSPVCGCVCFHLLTVWGDCLYGLALPSDVPYG